MRKQTKLVAVLSAAALLAIGASMTSFAADRGWVEENGVWMYLDSDGEAVVEEWKKSQGLYFWLDENGEMATDILVDDGDNTYYVDANGARVTNAWRLVDNEDGWSSQDNDEEPAQIYYYFGSNGRAVTGKKTIQGKSYFFDEDGQMFYGWYTHDSGDGKSYYLGEENEGWAYTGWHLLDVKEEVEDNYDDDECWFNFKSSGEMRKAAAAGEVSRAYINGAYYGFDEEGVMVDGWLPGNTTTATANTFYVEDNGNQPKGWVFTYTVDDWDDQDDDQQWYYLSSKGRPFNVGSDYLEKSDSTKYSTALATKWKEGDVVDKDPTDDGNRYTGVAAKYIKKETYLFGSDGVMLSGVIQLVSGANEAKGAPRVGGSSSYLTDGIYYFNKNDGSSLGQMETGKVTVNYDGENYYYNLRKKTTSYEEAGKTTTNGVGSAYTNAIVDGCIYDSFGARVNADESREVYTITDGDGFDFPIRDDDDEIIATIDSGDDIIISSSGKITKSGTVTIDGTKYKVVDYVATQVED